MDMIDRRMNDRGKMWRHVYKVSILLEADPLTPLSRPYKSLTIVFTVDQRMSSDGERITYTSLNRSANSNTSTMKA